MILSAIAAYSKNRVIGIDNQLPWHLPADMRYFMRTTKGHHVLMGRKTYESMGVPLKNRTNIVVTSNPFYVGSGLVVVHSINEGIKYARDNGEEELFIIGGAEIYRQSLPLLDKLYVTEIDLEVKGGDAFFPEFSLTDWTIESDQPCEPDNKNKHPFAFRVYKKKDQS